MKILKNYSTIICLGSSIIAGSAQAAVINVTNLTSSESLGSIMLDSIDIASLTTVSASITETDGNGVGYGATNTSIQDNTFNISGLTLDGVGTGDDSLSFVIRVTALGVTANTTVPSLTVDSNYTMSMEGAGYWGNTGALPGTSRTSSTGPLNEGEGLMFTYATGSVVLGSGATEAYKLTFGGFDSVRYDYRAGTASGVVSLDGAVSTIVNANSDKDLDLGQADEVIFGNEAGRFRLGLLDFSVTAESAVPEPSTWALLMGSLGLFLVILRRRFF